MIPSPAQEPRVHRETFMVDEYDLVSITLSDSSGRIAVLTFDRLADQKPVLALIAGPVTTVLNV